MKKSIALANLHISLTWAEMQLLHVIVWLIRNNKCLHLKRLLICSAASKCAPNCRFQCHALQRPLTYILQCVLVAETSSFDWIQIKRFRNPKHSHTWTVEFKMCQCKHRRKSNNAVSPSASKIWTYITFPQPSLVVLRTHTLADVYPPTSHYHNINTDTWI